MSINTQRVLNQDYELVLSKFFPIEYRDKLRLYTGEELFYVYKLATFKAKRGPNGYAPSDLFYLALKAKLYSWLRGDTKYPIYPSAWQKLGSRFRSEFNTWCDPVLDPADLQEALDRLKEKYGDVA